MLPDSAPGRERSLLLAAALFVLLNRLALTLNSGDPWWSMWSFAAWGACALGLHLALNYLLPERDPFILPVVMLLSGWGLVLIDRLVPSSFTVRQAIWLGISSAACVAMAYLPAGLRMLRRYRYTWLLLGLSLLGLTLIFGVNPSRAPGAARLWLNFAGVYFQPSELLKLLLLVFLASYLSERGGIITSTTRSIGPLRLPPLPYVAPMLLMWGFCMVLLIWQRDLGAASLFFLIFLAVLYAATGETFYLVAGIGLLMIGGALGYSLFDVVRLRVDAWWDPWPEADNRAYQIVQALLAVAEGGVFGQGIGGGAPGYVPVVHTDFVYVAIAEEYGLAGSLGVITALALLVSRALRIALREDERPFHALMAAGIGALIAIQSLMIIGGVLKIIPLTGVTLPFLSYGGSSLLASFVMVGLLLRISDRQSSPQLSLPGWLP